MKVVPSSPDQLAVHVEDGDAVTSAELVRFAEQAGAVYGSIRLADHYSRGQPTILMDGRWIRVTFAGCSDRLSPYIGHLLRNPEDRIFRGSGVEYLTGQGVEQIAT